MKEKEVIRPIRSKRKIKPDDIIFGIGQNMVEDFRSTHSNMTLDLEPFWKACKERNAGKARAPLPPWRQAPYELFKRYYQIESLFKRYIFTEDVYSPSDLQLKAKEDFIIFQANNGTYGEYKLATKLVLQRTRVLIKSVLGRVDLEEITGLSAFGRRANFGVPYAESYLDTKIKILSGSPESHTFFQEEVLGRDHLLKEIVTGQGCKPLASDRMVTNVLTLTAVPKSFKANRTIVPNSVIGAFVSKGIERYIARKLKDIGLPLARLPQRHQRLACRSSRTRDLVTADLSKASDLFLPPLINRLVPREWYNLLKLGRISSVEDDGKNFHITSFMMMGIGYTFPLQTLIFWALLKTLADSTNIKGVISVFGDDLLYPRKLHPYVLGLFKDLGFIINTDKTFVNEYFRESCGGDFYHGKDVRPYMPTNMEGGNSLASESYLYKLLNGLLFRWDPKEIPRTVHYLLRLIANVNMRVLRVPSDFPDHSGLKYDVAHKALYELDSYSDDLQCRQFFYIGSSTEFRMVKNVKSYYWERLRDMSKPVTPSRWDAKDDSSVIIWRWIRLHKNGRKIKRRVAFVPRKNSTRLVLGLYPCDKVARPK